MIDVKKINIVVDKFVKGLELIEAEVKLKEEEFIKETEKTKQLQVDLKAEYEQKDKGIQATKDKYNSEIERLAKLQEEVTTEISRYNELNSKAEIERKTAEELKNDAQAERDKAAAETIRKKKISEEAQAKLNALQDDTKKIEEQQAKLKKQEASLDKRESVCSKREAKIKEDEQKNADTELNLKLKTEEVKRAEKRFKLNG